MADIPFDFQLAGQVLPAGQYIIKPVTTDGSLVMVSHRFQLHRAFVHAEAGERTAASERSEVVFHKYGDRYHMVRIRHKDMDAGTRVIRTDKELVRRVGGAAPAEIAMALTAVR